VTDPVVGEAGPDAAAVHEPTAPPATPTDDAAPTPPAQRPLAAGDMVLLVDGKARRYLVTLEAGAEWIQEVQIRRRVRT